MNDQQLADLFRYHWKKPGGMHWAFNRMSDAVRDWQRWGIDCLPDATPGAVRMLAPDVAQDDAWHEQLLRKMS